MILSRRARNLTPYVPGEQPSRQGLYIKLNTNENPYPPSPAVEDAVRNSRWEDLRLYPDPSSARLRETISRLYGLRPTEVFTGNGSDEVLSFAWYAFFDPDNGPVLIPEHSYSFYPVYSCFYEQPFTRVPLSGDFSLDIDAFIQEMQGNYAGIVFPNPNAPTGIETGQADIRRLLDATKGERLLIIDEAYVDFGACSSVSLLRDYPNLLLVHTCSKSRSLAGLRVGYALGSEEVTEGLTRVKDSFNSYPLDRFSQKIAEIAIKDEPYYAKIRRTIEDTRKRFTGSLEALSWTVLPSKANFVFARHPSLSGEEVYQRLKNSGFLVRHFSHQGIEDFLRITIGTERDMEKLTKKIGELS